jgi:L-lysine 2,3-aminomutase
MITRTAPGWQTELARAVRDPGELLEMLGLARELLPHGLAAACGFSLRVPRPYVARMRHGDAADPLLRQVLPIELELDTRSDFLADPVGDLQAVSAPSVLHKYRGRVLLVTTGACAVHCRYCFRRHFPYGEASLTPARVDAALACVRADSSIREVILSGGDPLSLSDARLAELTEAIAQIPHVQRLRVHTRLPIVLPQRVDAALVGWLTASRLRPVVVVHANHPNELDAAVGGALERLAAAGVTLLNQAVLLRGVNDSVEVLAALSEALFEARVLPYYVHLLDRVQGAAHFEVEEPRARTLETELRARLPGYLMPRFVREIAGAPFKTPLADLGARA